MCLLHRGSYDRTCGSSAASCCKIQKFWLLGLTVDKYLNTHTHICLQLHIVCHKQFIKCLDTAAEAKEGCYCSSCRAGCVSCCVGRRIPVQRTGPCGRTCAWSAGSSACHRPNETPSMSRRAATRLHSSTALTDSHCSATTTHWWDRDKHNTSSHGQTRLLFPSHLTSYNKKQFRIQNKTWAAKASRWVTVTLQSTAFMTGSCPFIRPGVDMSSFL